MSEPRPLALTMGDPAGIGGELSVRAWLARRLSGPVFVLLDDPDRLVAVGRALGRTVPVRTVNSAAEAAAVFPDALPVLAVSLAVPAEPGRPDPANAAAVVAAIEQATRLCLAGEAAAVVTNPVSKALLHQVGFPHPGQTEFIAALTGTTFVVTMLASPMLRVVPVTVHVSLREALAALSTETILATARVTAGALRRDFGVMQPRLAIAGLNPHAGEHASMGDEEVTLIEPAIEQLRLEALEVSGPWPPETMFTAEARARYDVAIGMYHDQVLIPLKTLDMARGVNVTLGLPIIRTSPDHGPAFRIAGSGRADPASLLASLDLAADLAARRQPG